MTIPYHKLNLRRARQQERGVAAALGGRTVVASGALPAMKGDVRAPSWLVECKTTESSHYSLTLKTLRKIEGEAAMEARHPCLQLNMKGRRYVVLPYELWVLLASHA